MNATVLQLPGPAARPRRRLHVLLALAALILLALWLWPRPQVDDIVGMSGTATGQRGAATGARSDTDQPEPGFAVRARTEPQRDLFAPHSWYRAPPPVIVKPAPPPPPMAPAFPYSFFGRYERGGEKPVIILQRGESVYDAHVGDVLDGAWNIDAFDAGHLTVTYIPLQQKQTVSTGSIP